MGGGHRDTELGALGVIVRLEWGVPEAGKGGMIHGQGGCNNTGGAA